MSFDYVVRGTLCATGIKALTPLCCGKLERSVLTSTGPFWVSSVAFCGADPGFKEATGLCSGLEAADPTICHFGRDLVPPWSCTVGSKSTKMVFKKEY